MSVAQVDCIQCGIPFEVRTEYFQKYGPDPRCFDCVIHTECHDCGCGLRLLPSRYQELGGDPVVCMDCDEASSTTRRANEKTSFWYGLTPGEKIVFPGVVLVFVASIGLLITEPQVTTDNVGRALATCTLLAAWIIHRGKKNNPNT